MTTLASFGALAQHLAAGPAEAAGAPRPSAAPSAPEPAAKPPAPPAAGFPLALTCTAWRPHPRGGTGGYAAIEMPALGLRFPSVAVGRDGFAHIPARRDEGPDGKPVWRPILGFASAAAQAEFSRAVAEAVRAAFPEAAL